MTIGIPPSRNNPLQYSRETLSLVPADEAARDPLPTDIRPIFTMWRNTTNDNAWILSGFISGVPNWQLFQFGASPSGNISSLKGNTGAAVGPIAGLVNIVGDGTTITIAGNPGTHTLTASLIGGGPATETFTVQQATSPGVTTVTPSSNNIVVNGNAVAGHSVPIETRSRALHAFNVEAQYGGSAASATATQSGLVHFNNTQFTVDNTTGFVALTAQPLVSWVQITQSSQPAHLVVNTGYFCNAGGTNTLVLPLPTTAAIGNIIEITLDGATSFQVTQAASQQIRYGNLQTTAGTGGSLTTTAAGNTIRMVAQSATKWNVLSSLGSITVI